MLCVLCGNTSGRRVYAPEVTKPRILTRCNACGLLQMDPMPSDSELAAYYQEYDVLGEHSAYFQGLAQPNAMETAEGKDFVQRVDWMLAHVPTPTSTLDVGSGSGFFLEIMKSRGLTAEGVEINERAAATTAQRVGTTVHPGTVFDVPERTYQAVTLWDVVEHVNDPLGLLDRVHDLVEQDGWLFIETPNEGALLDRSVLGLDRLGLRWPAEMFYGIHHIVLFRAETIRDLLQRAGFEIVEIRFAETQVQRVFNRSSLRSLISWTAVSTLFLCARLVKMQNKLLIAARRV